MATDTSLAPLEVEAPPHAPEEPLLKEYGVSPYSPRGALTARQQQTLDIIRGWIVEHGRPPTFREIGRIMGIRSTNGVGDHLKALARKGFIRTDAMLSRSIQLISDPLIPTEVDSSKVPTVIEVQMANVAKLAWRVHVEKNASWTPDLKIALTRLYNDSEAFAALVEGTK